MTDKVFVAQGVANRLHATEKAIDTAVSETAQLMAAMMSARGELNFAAEVADEATSKVAEAMHVLVQARRAVVAAHQDLAEVQLRIGVRTRMIGDYKPKKASAPASDAARMVG